MIKYVDFDDVILYTSGILFDNYYKDCKKTGVELDLRKYIQEFDWEWLLSVSPIINDSINIIRDMNDVEILTKVNSLDNEGVAKIRYLRSKGIKSNIILVPFNLKKTDIVDSRGKILLDDTVHNLDDWFNHSGTPIFFHRDNLDVDGWGRENKMYIKTRSLKILRRY